MARFFGKIGYANSTEDPAGSGVWVNVITEVEYTGDVIRNIRQLQFNDELNPDISLNNSISVVADQYAIDHFSKIRYVEWAGARWTVTSVEVRSPRLILNLGSVYNGPTP